MNEIFRKFAQRSSEILGSAWAFIFAIIILVTWGISGPIFHFSDTWQLVINTGTTIITFLMVFLIQNTQNRDAKAIHLKLDELLRAVEGARTSLVNLETLSDEDLGRLQDQFARLKEHSVDIHETLQEAGDVIEELKDKVDDVVESSGGKSE